MKKIFIWAIALLPLVPLVLPMLIPSWRFDGASIFSAILFFPLAGLSASVFIIWGLIRALRSKDKFMTGVLVATLLILVYAVVRLTFF